MTEMKTSEYRRNYLEKIYCFLAVCYFKEPKFGPTTALFEKNIEFLHKSLKGSELYKQVDLCYSDWLAHTRIRRKIKEDYIRLFQQSVIMISGLLPRETYYRDTHILTKHFNGKSSNEIVSFYNSACPDFLPDSGEAPDHIGNELMFAANLVREEMKANQSGNQVLAEHYAHLRCSLLDKHMIRWLPDFCRDVHEKANTTFYHTVADLTIYFVKQDYDDLQARFQSEQTVVG